MSLLDDVLNEDRGLERDRELIEDLRDMRTEELISCIDDMVPYVKSLTEQGHENDAIVNEVCNIYSNIYQGSESNEEVDDKIEYLCHFARINGVCPTELEENREVFENTERHEGKISEFYDEKYGETGLSSILRDANEYERFANAMQGLLDVLEERGIHDPTLSFAIKHLNDEMKLNEEIANEDRLLEPCINGFVRSLTDSEKESFLPLPVDEGRRTAPEVDEYFREVLEKYPPCHDKDKLYRSDLDAFFADKIYNIGRARGMAEDERFQQEVRDLREMAMFNGADRLQQQKEHGAYVDRLFEVSDYMTNFMDSLTREERMSLIPENKWEAERMGMEHSTAFCREINGYANLNNQMLDKLSEYLEGHKCLEVMAGTGMLSAALQERGVDILATDKSAPEHNDYGEIRGIPSLCDIKEMDALDAIREHGVDIDYLVMSWPPYNDPIAANCIETLYEVNPDAKILYIGEDYGGCTADDRFFDLVIQEDPKNNGVSVEEINDLREPTVSIFSLNDRVIVFDNYVEGHRRDELDDILTAREREAYDADRDAYLTNEGWYIDRYDLEFTGGDWLGVLAKYFGTPEEIERYKEITGNDI